MESTVTDLVKIQVGVLGGSSAEQKLGALLKLTLGKKSDNILHSVESLVHSLSPASSSTQGSAQEETRGNTKSFDSSQSCYFSRGEGDGGSGDGWDGDGDGGVAPLDHNQQTQTLRTILGQEYSNIQYLGAEASCLSNE